MRANYFCLRCGIEFVGDFHQHNEYTGAEQGGPIEPGQGSLSGGPAAPAVCADCRPLLTPEQALAWGVSPK